jgi:hypothetical protein
VTGARALTVAALALTVAACRAHPPPDLMAPDTGASAEADETPVDRLAPGELVEGSDEAYGLKLPRGLDVTSRFAPVVYASGRLPVRPVVDYLRARLQGGELREGPTSATFQHVLVRGGQPDRELSVHVAQTVAGVTVEMRNTTPPRIPDMPNDAERMKRVGLNPHGGFLDPKHLD